MDRIPHLVLSAMEAHDFRASPTSAGLPENCKKPNLGDFGSFPIAPKQTIAMLSLIIYHYLSLSLVHLGPRTVCHWWLEGVASVQDQTNPNQVWTPCILVAFLNSYLFVASLGSTRRTSVVTVNVTCSQERKSAEFVFRHVWNIWMIQRL